MSLKTLPPISEAWTKEDLSSLTINEVRRLQVILEKKLYNIVTVYEERLLAPKAIREALELQALCKQERQQPQQNKINKMK